MTGWIWAIVIIAVIILILLIILLVRGNRSICLKSGSLDEPCPCGEGYACVNGICKAVIGGVCSNNDDCEQGVCSQGICKITDPNLFDCDSSSSSRSMSECKSYGYDSSKYTKCSSDSKTSGSKYYHYTNTDKSDKSDRSESSCSCTGSSCEY